MTIRHHLLTGEPILFAPDRSVRPNAFGNAPEPACPFCPGQEHETPPELARVGEPWRVRVVPNKYPASAHHEVIIEAPDHEAQFEQLDATEIVRTYRERYAATEAKYVALFKNHGALAGATLRHLHSQLVALDFLPPRIERERRAFELGCPLCDAAKINVIDENETFVRVAPEAATLAYQQWLIPKRHAPEMTSLGSDADLAAMLQASAARMRRVSESYNWIFVNFPRVERGHWYVDLFPRFGAVAGFELGTGTFIQTIDPARAMEVLR